MPKWRRGWGHVFTLLKINLNKDQDKSYKVENIIHYDSQDLVPKIKNNFNNQEGKVKSNINEQIKEGLKKITKDVKDSEIKYIYT